ncbi:MAG TPA: TAXI family TRAP transporter solute-binding subunit [Gammaproteobacteria bacterium]|nr:TAXI family TRAP transporter solute-binding subunit [Gammaproteobacteria bacterium]
MRVREHGRLSGARVFEAAAAWLALCCALAGCSESPTTLRIVSGPPDANERVAALLESASAEVEARVRLVRGPAVAGAEAALDALDHGSAELAIVENSASYRHPDVRTVIPLYPSVLHIGVRPDKRAETLAQVLRGATVFAGDEQTPARQLLDRMKSIYAWREIEFSYADSIDSRTDVIFTFAPITPSAAPLFDGFELFSLGDAAYVGTGSAADGLALVAPFLRSFVIPEGTYGPLTPAPIATVALDQLLVARADTSIVVVYDLIQSVQAIGPLLVAQRPDLAIDELETFDISHVTFPVHAGTMAFRARNDPGFAERASSIFEMAVTIVVALVTALFALVRFVRGLRKGRIDKFYSATLDIRAKLAGERNPARRKAYVSRLRALRAEAFSLLIKEKLAADDSFRILQALIYDVIREAEAPFEEIPAALEPSR